MTAEYHKIQSVYLRDPATNHKTFLMGEWAKPEFGYLADLRWRITEKVDGTNIRIFVKDDGDIAVRGKTDSAQTHPQLLDAIRDLTKGKADILKGLTLYGEGYGAGIQSGGTYRQDKSFVLFDVFAGGLWLERENVEDVAAKLGIEVVPELSSMTLREAVQAVRRGIASRWGNFMAEGVVCRPMCEMFNRRGERIITKIKHKDFIGVDR